MVKIDSNDINTKEILEWKGLHLLHFRGSSCSQKLRIYLNLKKINWTAHSINLASGKNYTKWFLGINPKGLIPVLIDNGHVEIESNDILMYLENKYPDNTLSISSNLININEFLNEEDDLHEDIRNIAYRYMFGGLGKKNQNALKKFKDHKSFSDELDKLKMNEVEFYTNFGKKGITDEAIKKSLSKFMSCYRKYESLLSNHKYLTGNSLSLVDIAWFIYTYRLFISGFPFKDQFPNVSSWFHRLYSRNEFYREVNDPWMFKMIRFYARFSTLLTGKSIKNLLS